MRYTKSAVGMLTGQYRSVLKKCLMINLGLFALVSTAAADKTFPVPQEGAVWSFTDVENLLPITQYTVSDSGEITATDRKYVYIESGDASITPPSGYTNQVEKYRWVSSGYDNTQLLMDSEGKDVWVNYMTDGTDSTAESFYLNVGYITNGSYTDPDIVGGNNTSVTPGHVYTNSTITGSLGYNHVFSGGSALSYINKTNPLGDINNDFIRNRAVYTGYRDEVHALGGAAAFNKATIGNISGNFIGNSVTISESSDYFIYAHGGAIYNGFRNPSYDTGVVTNTGIISGDFIGNYTYVSNSYNGVGYSFGGAIYNGGTTAGIEGNFIGNYTFAYANKRTGFATGGAINNYGTINYINSDFSGNYSHSESFSTGEYSYANAGALYNVGKIGNINGNFSDNFAYARNDNYRSIAEGGAIYNHGSSKGMGNISGNFINNYVSGTGVSYVSDISGGAIYNSGRIGNINSNFIGNYAFLKEGPNGEGYAHGGAIFNGWSNDGIGNISGNFINNYALGDVSENASVAGGAIYSTAPLAIKDATFTHNITSGKGGAIYNTGTAYIIAESDDVNFTGNKAGATFEYTLGSKGKLDTVNITSGNAEAIYNNNGEIYLNAAEDKKIIFNDAVAGNNGKIYLNKTEGLSYTGAYNGTDYDTENVTQKGGIYAFNNTVSGNTLYLYDNARVELGNNQQPVSDADDTLVTYKGTLQLVGLVNDENGGIIDTRNDNIGTHDLGTVELHSALEIAIDVDADKGEADIFTMSSGDNAEIQIGDIAFMTEKTAFDGTVQVINNTTGSPIKLALADSLIEKYSEGVTVSTESGFDNLTSGDVKWNGDYGAYKIETINQGTFTTDDEDSISYNITSSQKKTYEDGGKLLAAINQSKDYADKSFNFDAADNVFISTDDLGTTYGNVTINGVASGDKKSTVDLDGHNGFVVGAGTGVALNNAKLTDSAGKAAVEIADGGKMSMQNSELSGVNLNVEGEFDAANNKVFAPKATFGKNSTLKLLVNNIKDDYGAFKADSFDIAQGAKLDVTFGQNPLGGDKNGEVALLSLNDGSDINNNNFADEFHNNMYKFTRKSEKSGIYGVYQTKTAEEVSRENGGTKTNQQAAAAWVDGASFAGGAAAEIADTLADLAQNNGASFNEALTALAPDSTSMAQIMAVETMNRIFGGVGAQLAKPSDGLASGDALDGVSVWGNVYYNKAKLSDRADGVYGFDADSKGITAGVDKKVTPSIKLGLGIQYDRSDIEAFKSDIDVDTAAVFGYGEYRPNNWFVSGVAAYGRSDYDEKKYVGPKTIKANYDADLFALQALTGYDVITQYADITPSVGLRYNYIKRHGYNDGADQDISGNNSDILTGVIGLRAAKNYGAFRPSAYLNFTYDMVSDRDSATVGLKNGSSYTVAGKRLNKFATEIGAALEYGIGNWDFAAHYDYAGRKHFNSHTGMLSAKYNF